MKRGEHGTVLWNLILHLAYNKASEAAKDWGDDSVGKVSKARGLELGFPAPTQDVRQSR